MIKNRGQLSIQILIYSAVATILLSGFLVWAYVVITSASRAYNRSVAFSIAEAGAEYYRWHLAHDNTDYTDGTGGSGPYVHDYFDKNGVRLGQFSLEIIPPPIGSTVVTIKSTGKIDWDPTIEKIIEVKMGIPSFAKYAAVLNADVRFGSGTNVYGLIHSNGGIRFDGVAYNIVSSALSDYNDPDHSGANEFGVHTHANPIDPLPPAAVPNRTDIFKVGRQFPVPVVDFAGITADLAQMKSDASSTGYYYGPSGALGYHIVLKTDDTFDIYRVNTLVPPPSNCTNVLNQSGWSSWSIQAETLIQNRPFPANGIIFVEDELWINGQINGARLIFAAGRFPDNPSTRPAIAINNDLLYTNYDGTDTIGLIAQGNINIGLVSEDDLKIDAALVAQNGRVGRYYYRPPGGGQNRCSPYHVRQIITPYGMIASNQRYGFAYTDGTGYQIRNLIYDANLLYNPPPSFPLTTDTYEIISWKELK